MSLPTICHHIRNKFLFLPIYFPSPINIFSLYFLFPSQYIFLQNESTECRFDKLVWNFFLFLFNVSSAIINYILVKTIKYYPWYKCYPHRKSPSPPPKLNAVHWKVIVSPDTCGKLTLSNLIIPVTFGLQVVSEGLAQYGWLPCVSGQFKASVLGLAGRHYLSSHDHHADAPLAGHSTHAKGRVK